MAQMQTVSIRLPDEDFQWLLSAQEGAGKTPSEKLRMLVARVRQQESGLSNPDVCAEWMRSLVQPMMNAVATWERQHKEHSELMSAVLDTVPRIMAIVLSGQRQQSGLRERGESGDSGDSGESMACDLHEIEAALAQQSFRLLTTLLRAAVTTNPAVYDKEAIDRYLPDILEITEIISTRKDKERKNG